MSDQGNASDTEQEMREHEREVLELLRGEMTTAEIAHCLGVADVTVRRHVSAILAKLRVPDRKAMARLFEEDRAAR